jgi:predicted GIY-YIG superfamily endonuclease
MKELNIWSPLLRKMRFYEKKIQRLIDQSIPLEKWIIIPKDALWSLGYLDICGVYVLYFRKKIIYIGVSCQIAKRIQAHFSNFPKQYDQKISAIKIKRFNHNKAGWVPSRAENLEKDLIRRLRPKYNIYIPHKYCLADYLPSGRFNAFNAR